MDPDYVKLVRTGRISNTCPGVLYLPGIGGAVYTRETDPIPAGHYWLRPDATGRFTHYVVEALDKLGSRVASLTPKRDAIEVHFGSVSRGCILVDLDSIPTDGAGAIEKVRKALGRDTPEPPTHILEIVDALY